MVIWHLLDVLHWNHSQNEHMITQIIAAKAASTQHIRYKAITEHLITVVTNCANHPPLDNKQIYIIGNLAF